ncbi:MAG: fumarate hydratase [Actinomycetota bacterium]|nr:fumarate hydratase [Actinomycetota bacterium]
MKSIKITTVTKQVEKLIAEASFNLPPDIISALKYALAEETSPVARKILGYILENEQVARKERLPLCQDCGTGIY